MLDIKSLGVSKLKPKWDTTIHLLGELKFKTDHAKY